MRILRMSILTGRLHQMDLKVTKNQLLEWIIERKVAQRVFPFISPDHREFLITGTSPEEQKAYYSSIEITEYIPEHVDGIFLLPEENIKEILNLIELYQPIH